MPLHRIPWAKPISIKRENLSLFRWASADSRWTALPLQLDAMDKDGDLIFPVPQDWMGQKIAPFDRLAISPSAFGDRFTGKEGFPCGGEERFEIRGADKFAYLISCIDKKLDSNFESPVLYDEKQRLLRTPYYRYRYSERNHLVFDDIQLVDAEFKAYETVAAQSDLVIIGDVKNFLTLVFDTEDIDARISHQRQGPLGLVGGLQFFLRVLAFRIELALLPEVNFFENSLYMPMTMYLPVDAGRYLRRGSGVYYTWDRGRDSEWLFGDSEMETLDPASVDPEFKGPLSKPDPRFCTPMKCTYSLKGKVRGRAFSLNFGISRAAAELGFFPRLIREAAAVEKVLKRPVSRFPAPDRFGVYFETSRLPKGTHKWDFWIRIESEQSQGCDRPVSIAPLIR